MRKIIWHYIKDTHLLKDLTEENAGNDLCRWESVCSQHNVQIWMVRLVNSQTRKIRLKIVNNRTSETLKDNIKRLVPKGNWKTKAVVICYNFISQDDSGYTQYVHNHEYSKLVLVCILPAILKNYGITSNLLLNLIII